MKKKKLIMNYNLPHPKTRRRQYMYQSLNNLISDFYFWLLPIEHCYLATCFQLSSSYNLLHNG